MMNPDGSLISRDEARELLGDGAEGLDDAAIDDLRFNAQSWAELLIDLYLDQQRANKSVAAPTDGQ